MCTRWVEAWRNAKTATIAGLLAAVIGTTLVCADGYPSKFEFGQAASQEDIAPVAIAIPADGKGLPPGRGSYDKGKQVYETSCAACHGPDLKGVLGLPDMPSGAALRLIGGRGTLTSQKPIVTVESYWPYATTLFDYIRRAMPYMAPGSLSDEDVYAVSTYILADGNIVDRATILDAETLPKVMMPNRDGFIPDPRPELFK
jgi:mono/diheme cytochrome c family protein